MYIYIYTYNKHKLTYIKSKKISQKDVGGSSPKSILFTLPLSVMPSDPAMTTTSPGKGSMKTKMAALSNQLDDQVRNSNSNLINNPSSFPFVHTHHCVVKDHGHKH